MIKRHGRYRVPCRFFNVIPSSAVAVPCSNPASVVGGAFARLVSRNCVLPVRAFRRRRDQTFPGSFGVVAYSAGDVAAGVAGTENSDLVAGVQIFDSRTVVPDRGGFETAGVRVLAETAGPDRVNSHGFPDSSAVAAADSTAGISDPAEPETAAEE